MSRQEVIKELSKIRLLVLILLLLFDAGCTTKERCTVSLTQSPELRAFRLGMTISDIQKRFPGFPPVLENEFGVATVEISNEYKNGYLNRRKGEDVFTLIGPEYLDFNGLKHIELKLLDGRLVEISAFYPKDIKWESADEFVKRTADALKLNGTWENIRNDESLKLLQCGSQKGPDEMFMVSAGFKDAPMQSGSPDTTRLPFVTLEDFMHGEMEVFRRKQKLEEKAKQEEQQRKETFNP